MVYSMCCFRILHIQCVISLRTKNWSTLSSSSFIIVLGKDAKSIDKVMNLYWLRWLCYVCSTTVYFDT